MADGGVGFGINYTGLGRVVHLTMLANAPHTKTTKGINTQLFSSYFNIRYGENFLHILI